MHESRYLENNGRTLTATLAQVKDEVKEFVQTRAQMLSSELREKLSDSKKAAMYAGIGLGILATSFLLITLALVGLLAVAFWGSPYAWFFAFLIAGVFYALLGGMLVMAARREFTGLVPRRTIEVLKEDKIWLQSEARSRV